jgi:hypothetical protein
LFGDPLDRFRGHERARSKTPRAFEQDTNAKTEIGCSRHILDALFSSENTLLPITIDTDIRIACAKLFRVTNRDISQAVFIDRGGFGSFGFPR